MFYVTATSPDIIIEVLSMLQASTHILEFHARHHAHLQLSQRSQHNLSTGILVLIVLVNGYEGLVFSHLVAISIGSVWPMSLKDLMDEKSYCLFSREQVRRYESDEKLLGISSFV